MPIHRLATDRSGACTTREAAELIALWQSLDPLAPEECSETQGPKRRTRDIPTSPAWRQCPRCQEWTIPDCGTSCAILADVARQDPRRARCERRSDKTASTTAIQQMPDVEHCERHQKYLLEPAMRRIRRLLRVARRRWTQTPGPGAPS